MMTKEMMMKVFLPSVLDEIALLIWKEKTCNTLFFSKTYWRMYVIILYEGLMLLKSLILLNFFAPKTIFNLKKSFQEICLRNYVTFMKLFFVTVGFNHNLRYYIHCLILQNKVCIKLSNIFMKMAQLTLLMKSKTYAKLYKRYQVILPLPRKAFRL